MSKLTKKQKVLAENLDTEKTYSVSEAMEIFKSVKSDKFEESVDISIRLGVDPNKSDQNVRGAVTLPNSLGKQVSVAVFADGDQADAAKEAGAEYIGMDDLAEKFTKEEISVDVVVSASSAMRVVGKLGQILGPKGLMPNPKTGTVTDDVATAVNNAKAGQVRFRTDKNGIIHGSIGKLSFDNEKIISNATALISELTKLKPASAKGVFIGNIALSSTMGPGVKVSLTAFDEYANSSDERTKEDALKRHKQSLKNHIDSLNKKNYQGIKDLKTLDTVIMFVPNEKALELPDKGGLKLVEYALSKKVTLCGPSMLFLIFKVVEYFWKADKQSKNIMDVIELANKISTQTVDIYNSAKKAQDSIQKTSLGVSEVMDKIKDGKGSLLSKTSKMNKIGGLTPKKLPPSDIEDDQDKIDGQKK